MGNERNELFGILRAALWSYEVVQSPISEKVREELRAHAVDGLVSMVVPQLADERYNRAARFVHMVCVQSEIIRILQQAQISAVVLKGTASGIYYPQPCLRSYGDIDILVHPDNYQSSIKLLSENGFQWNGSFG